MNLNDYSVGLQGQLVDTERRLSILLDSITGPVPEKPPGQAPQEPGLLGRLKSIANTMEQISQRISSLEGYLQNQNQACLGNGQGMAAQVSRPGLRN